MSEIVLTGSEYDARDITIEIRRGSTFEILLSFGGDVRSGDFEGCVCKKLGGEELAIFLFGATIYDVDSDVSRVVAILDYPTTASLPATPEKPSILPKAGIDYWEWIVHWLPLEPTAPRKRIAMISGRVTTLEGGC